MNFEETWDFVMEGIPQDVSDLSMFKAIAKAFYIAGVTAGLEDARRAVRESFAEAARR